MSIAQDTQYILHIQTGYMGDNDHFCIYYTIQINIIKNRYLIYKLFSLYVVSKYLDRCVRLIFVK